MIQGWYTYSVTTHVTLYSVCFHVTAVGAACAAIPFCHEMVSTRFGFDILKLILGI